MLKNLIKGTDVKIVKLHSITNLTENEIVDFFSKSQIVYLIFLLFFLLKPIDFLY